jgi:hypothetical protein
MICRTFKCAGGVLLLVLGLAACDVDLFGNDRRPLIGPYGIFVGEGKFYLVLDQYRAPCGGLLDAAVYQIGWNDATILVQVEPCGGANGPPSGWRVVDIQSRKIAAITAEHMKARPDLMGIKLVRANDAWSGRYPAPR